MFDNILWYAKKNYLSFRPKKCKKKTNKLLNILKWKFHLYHLKLTKGEIEKEKALLYFCSVEFTLQPYVLEGVNLFSSLYII